MVQDGVGPLLQGHDPASAVHVVDQCSSRDCRRGQNPGPVGAVADNQSALERSDHPIRLDRGTPNDRKDLKALVAACREPDAAKRFATMDKLMDIDRMAINASLQVIATDWDGYCRNRNNYRVYFDPKTKKAVFLPHGMDQMFASPHEGIFPGWGGMACRAVLDTLLRHASRTRPPSCAEATRKSS